MNTIKKSLHIYSEFELFKIAASKYSEADSILHNDISLSTFISNSKSNKINNLNITTQLDVSPKLDPYIKKYVTLYDYKMVYLIAS